MFDGEPSRESQSVKPCSDITKNLNGMTLWRRFGMNDNKKKDFYKKTLVITKFIPISSNPYADKLLCSCKKLTDPVCQPHRLFIQQKKQAAIVPCNTFLNREERHPCQAGTTNSLRHI